MNTNAHDPKRRSFLRQTIALGCVLSVPAIISGCDSRQEPPSPQSDVDEKGYNDSDTADAMDSDTSQTSEMQSAPAPSPAKVSKASASYLEQPNGEQKCANCQYFDAANNKCQVVEGQISPEGWCKLWVKQV